MGSFSWMYATPNPAKSSDLNIMPGDKVRLLIPEALGGGSIIGRYRDYGRIETAAGAVHDVYELLALWNSPTLRNILKECDPFYTDRRIVRKERDKNDSNPAKSVTYLLRTIGIDWQYGLYGDRLYYGLKFARVHDDVTYGTCRYFSAPDPNKGLTRASFATTKYAEWGLSSWVRYVRPVRDTNLDKPFVEPKVYDLSRLTTLRALLKGK